jgi:hypothetical protein
MTARSQLELSKLITVLNTHIRGHLAAKPDIAFGTVTSVSPLLVLIDGAQTPAPVLQQRQYAGTGAVGDRVMMHIVNNLYVVADAVI